MGLSLAVGATPPLQQDEACTPPPPPRERHSNCRPGALSVACCPPQPPPPVPPGPQAGSGLPELLCCEQGPLQAPSTPVLLPHAPLGQGPLPSSPLFYTSLILLQKTGDRAVKTHVGLSELVCSARPCAGLEGRGGSSRGRPAFLWTGRAAVGRTSGEEGSAQGDGGGSLGVFAQRWPLAGSPEPWPLAGSWRERGT